MTRMSGTIGIGGASGFWGEASHATAQLLADGRIDYLVYDYLAEITMALLARMRAKDAATGYVPDFLTDAMAPNLQTIAERGVRVISNAGGTNPAACAARLREMASTHGLDLKVAAVTGDDLLARARQFAEAGTVDMYNGGKFPDPSSIGSINAYIGAFPVAVALDEGANIVVTGRCVDSAPALAACIHAFGWEAGQSDLLAAGSLAGHILECGPQATGGNFTDWEAIAGGISDIGYPIAEVEPDGSFVLTKPNGSGGLVSVGTVSEQLLYEIGDPQAYVLPDVICDFSTVEIRQEKDDRVRVYGARGMGVPDCLKVCATYRDGFRGGHLFGYYGIDADRKARAFADAVLERTRAGLRLAKLADLTEASVEILGAESQFGTAASMKSSREVNAKIAVRHEDARGVEIMIRSAFGLGLSAPPGLSGFAGARPKPSPVMTLFSFLLDKGEVSVAVEWGQGKNTCKPPSVGSERRSPPRPPELSEPPDAGSGERVPLVRLAYGRSGDKGDMANIGIIARRPEYLPYLWAALDEDFVAGVFSHFLKGRVERYLLPGADAMNIVLLEVLGGGGIASLRNDPQGKGYAQLLLAQEIRVPKHLLEPD